MITEEQLKEAIDAFTLNYSPPEYNHEEAMRAALTKFLEVSQDPTDQEVDAVAECLCSSSQPMGDLHWKFTSPNVRDRWRRRAKRCIQTYLRSKRQ